MTNGDETEDEMIARRARELEALLEEHSANMASLPAVTNLLVHERPDGTVPQDILQRHNAESVERQRQMVSACRAYKRRVAEAVERHQREEAALRARLHAARAEAPAEAP